MPMLEMVAVGDRPDLWEELGFATCEGAVWIDGVCVRLGARTPGIEGWRLAGAEIPELPTAEGPTPAAPPATPHPNGVTHLDHVVIATPDLGRTIAAFEQAGVPLRRTRDAGGPSAPVRQAFFRLGGTIAEVVGSATKTGPGPARFSGLAFTVRDLDATAASLGDRLRPAKPAVQPRRRIATLDRAAGSSVPMAFLSAPLPES